MLNSLQCGALRFQGSAILFERYLGCLQTSGDGLNLLVTGQPPLVSLCDVRERFRVLRIQFAEPFLIEMNAALMAFDLAANLGPLLLRLNNPFLQFSQSGAELKDLL